MVVAATFLSTAYTFPHISSSNSLSSTLSIASSSLSVSFCLKKNRHLVVPLCKTGETDSPFPSSSSSPTPYVSKRSFALSLSSAFLLSFSGKGMPLAEAAPLEDEDDLVFLEKDRKKRLERQVVINSSTKEKGYLQDVVYKLNEVGQAMDSNDLNVASLVLGDGTDTDWIKKANSAFTKLSLGPEEKEEVNMFNTLISKLISSDVESSTIAFVSSASAFEKWTALKGFDRVLKGI